MKMQSEKGMVCRICGEENPRKHQDFCRHLGCSGVMVTKSEHGNKKTADNKVGLRLMCDAPKDGTEILAYHKNGKNLHQVIYSAGADRWVMRWNKEYSQHYSDFAGWVPIPDVVTQ